MFARARLLRGFFAAAAAGVIAGAFVVLRSSEPAVVVVGDLPDRLADTTYWRMFETMSEDGGYFRSDNFVSNETALQYVIPELQKRLRAGSAYIGVGPEQNFTYLVAFKPRIAFIVDIRRQNAMEHLMYKALIEMSADRADFLSALFARRRPPQVDTLSSVAGLMTAFTYAPRDTLLFRQSFNAVSDHLRRTHGFNLSVEDLASIDYVMRAFFLNGPGVTYTMGRSGPGGSVRRGGPPGFGGGMSGMPTFARLMVEDDGHGVERSFLATEANFRALKDLHTRNVIVPIVGDFGGPKALRAVGRYLESRGATVGVFYTSNVEQYLFMDSDVWPRFYANVSRLPIDERSTFIRSVTSRYAPRRQQPNARMVQLTLPIGELVKAYQDRKIRSYYDVIDMSR